MIGAKEILACRFVRPTDVLKADTRDRRTLRHGNATLYSGNDWLR